MRPEELMIGDWIYNRVANITFQVYPQFFSQWHNRSEQFEAIIQPIPLTPEILEKNFPTYEWLAWGPSDMLDTIPAFTIRIDEDYAHIEIDLRYVHELQHALRLCGIEKEITI